MTKEEYNSYVMKKAKKSPVIKDTINAFWIGGLICVVGEFLSAFYKSFELPEKSVATLTSVTLIIIAGVLTGLDVCHKIAKVAGAGTVVPITGFANSVIAPAMEFRREGLVMGVGAKLFTFAGPVLVYGVSASVIAGIITFFVEGMA